MELDFPVIDEAAVTPVTLIETPPVPVATKSTALAKVDVKAVALARFGEWRPGAEALVKKYANVVFDCSTTKGMAEATAARAEVREPRYHAQRVSKASKTELAQTSKAVGAEEAAVIAMLKATEDAIDAQIEAEITRKAKEKADAKLKNDERIAKLLANVSTIRGYVAQGRGKTSAQIAAAAASVAAMTFGPEWEEFAGEAANARDEVHQALLDMGTAAKAAEDAAEAAEAQRIEMNRVAAEQAETARLLKEASDKLAADMAAFAKQQADTKAAADKAEADAAEARRLAALPVEPLVWVGVDLATTDPAPAAEQQAVLVSAPAGVEVPPGVYLNGDNDLVEVPARIAGSHATRAADMEPPDYTEDEIAPRVFNKNSHKDVIADAPPDLDYATPAELRNEWAMFEKSLEHVMPAITTYCAAVDVTRFVRSLDRLSAIFSA